MKGRCRDEGECKKPQGMEAGAFIEPTVFADVTDDMTIAREEIFGPVMSVLPFETETEALARANGTPFGLAAGVFTSDLTRGHRVAAALQAGICWINTYNLTPVEAPFGGVKQSGLGREGSKYGLDDYIELKYISISASNSSWFKIYDPLWKFYNF